MELQRGKLNITIDGQFGSTGKGALNAWLATKNKIDVAISNAAPNAGHTFDVGEGKKVAFHLPVTGILDSDCLIYLCAGAIIEPELLLREMNEFGCHGRVLIHPRATILLPEHTEREKATGSGVTRLASTQKGVGAALADKVARNPNTVLAKDYYPKEMIKDVDVTYYLKENAMVVMEVPQGFGLSLNHGLSYPHCTSRDITVASALNDANVHPHYLGDVVVSMRTFPIRVGNIVDENGREIGYSGDFYPDSDELTWEEVGQEPEKTTVTKRIRRVASFSCLQYEQVLRTLRPTAVFLNFVNYFTDEYQLRELLIRMGGCENRANLHPQMIFGYGPSVSEVSQDVGCDDLRRMLKF